MFCCLVRIYKKVKRLVVGAVRGFFRRAEQRARQAWTAHRARVARNATYAAVTATVLAGALGLAPVTDVLSAVLGAFLGVYATQRGRGRGAAAWQDEDWI